MGVHVRGTLRDPMGNIMPFTNIRFTSTQGQGEMVAPTFAIYKTNSAGYYSFYVVDGVYYVEVLQLKEYDLDEYEVVGDALVNAGTPDVLTLGELLQFTTSIPPQDLLNLESFWDGKFTDLFGHFDTITKNLNTALIDGDTRVQNSWTTWTNDTLGARAAKRLEITQAETAKVIDLAFAYSDIAGDEMAKRVSKVETSASTASSDLVAYKEANGDIGAKITDAITVASGNIKRESVIEANLYTKGLEAVINDTIVVDNAAAKQELKLVRDDLGNITANWQVETRVGDITSSIGMVNDGTKSDVYVQANSFHFIDPNSRVYNPFSIIDGTVHMNNVVIGSDDDVPLTSDRQSRALLVDSSTYTGDNTVNFTGKTYSTIGYVSVRLKASASHVSVVDQRLAFTAVGVGTAEWSVNPSNVVLTTHPSKTNTKWLTASAFGYNKQVTISTTMDGLTDYVNVKLLRPTDGIVGFLNNEKVFYNSRWGWTTLATASTGLFNVFEGITRVSSNLVTYSIVEETGVTATIDWNGGYKVTSMGSNVDEGYVLFKAEYSGVTILRRLTISKNYGKFTSITGRWKTIKAASTGFSLKVNNTSLPSIITNSGDELWHSFEIEIKSGTNSLYLPPMSDGSEITGVVVTEGAVGDPENLLSFDGLYPNQNKTQIKSSDFDSTATGDDRKGWAIYENGDCEFNNGIFRGDLYATSLTLTESDTKKYSNDSIVYPDEVLNSEIVFPEVDLPTAASLGVYGAELALNTNSTTQLSGNYSAPTEGTAGTGWKVNTDGGAVFNEIVARGHIEATSGSFTNVVVDGAFTTRSAVMLTGVKPTRLAPFMVKLRNGSQSNRRLDRRIDSEEMYSDTFIGDTPYLHTRLTHHVMDVNFEILSVMDSSQTAIATTRVYVKYGYQNKSDRSYTWDTHWFEFVRISHPNLHFHTGTLPSFISYTTKARAWDLVKFSVRTEGEAEKGRPIGLFYTIEVLNHAVSTNTERSIRTYYNDGATSTTPAGGGSLPPEGDTGGTTTTPIKSTSTLLESEGQPIDTTETIKLHP
jgi:hypothetical protein